MIIPIPAIDIIQGEVVRLEEGNYQKKTIFSQQPVEIARQFEARGASWLHLVDLEGAKAGKPVNFPTIKKIIQSVTIPTEVGGGIRDLATLQKYLDAGAQRVIIGSIAVTNSPLLQEMLLQAGEERLVVSLDVKDGFLAVHGWLQASSTPASNLARELKQMGVSHFIWTNISRDGTQKGIDLEALELFLQESGISQVIVAGGVATLEDIRNLKKIEDRIEGVILGRALYSGAIQLEEVLKIVKEDNKC
ncbi:MAG: phosphoribosylformimino-5-aminoimidazole carboxamide ribotide isomerase [Candidatus Atribacteria bacterium]|nr:phosphoribosylformimino-5-aminoimidazole carboxamide ribotide isomerase [Candidatus Atribacteria bacterium]